MEFLSANDEYRRDAGNKEGDKEIAHAFIIKSIDIENLKNSVFKSFLGNWDLLGAKSPFKYHLFMIVTI